MNFVNIMLSITEIIFILQMKAHTFIVEFEKT